MRRVKCGRGFVNMRETATFDITKDTSVIIKEEPDMSSHHLSLAIVINEHSMVRRTTTEQGETNSISLPLLKKDAWEIGRTLMRLGHEAGRE